MADILEIKNLNKKFGGVIATKDLNLSILEGELHAIIGPNGAGKTTLISQIFGQIFPDSGQIFFQDTNVTKVSEYKRSRLGINRTFQITSVMKKKPERPTPIIAASIKIISMSGTLAPPVIMSKTAPLRMNSTHE